MRLDKLSLTAQEAMQSAMSVAGEHEAGSVEPLHLLGALLDAGENNIKSVTLKEL